MTNFVNFRIFEKTIQNGFSKPHSIGPKGSPWKKKNIFSKKQFFPTFLNLELNFFGLLAKKLAVCPNFRWLCPEEQFEENNVFKKILFCFSDFERKKFGQWPWFFICVIITAYWLSRGTIFGTFFWSSINRFVTFRLLGKKLGFCQNCILSSQKVVL